MTPSQRHLLMAALLLFVQPACSAAKPEPQRTLPTLLSRIQSTRLSPATGAKWFFHPTEVGKLLDVEPVAPQIELMVGVQGDRWQVDYRQHKVEASPSLAPEPLVVAQRRDEGWFFLGQSGTGYRAQTPLGPFVSIVPPTEPLALVAGGGTAACGITANGQLRSSVAVASPWVVAGPTTERFVDVAVDSEGRGVALAVPEALWVAGQVTGTWVPLNVEPFGAQQVAFQEDSGFVVTGLLGRYRVDPTERRTEPTEQRAVAAEVKFGLPLSDAPDAAAVVAGRASLLGDTYVELRRSIDGWRLLRGALARHLETHQVPAFASCGDLRLAAHGETMAVVCAKRADAATLQRMSLYLSEDAGESWTKESATFWGMLAEISLALGKRNQLMISGICAPSDSAAGCRPRGVYRLSRLHEPEPPTVRSSAGKARKSSLVAVALSGLSGVADALLYSADGEMGFVVGRREKTGRYAVYLNAGADEPFVVTEISQLPAPFVHEQQTPDSEGVRRDSFVRAAALGAEGSLSVLFRRRGESLLVVVDDDGQIRSIAAPPEHAGVVGVAGVRAIALQPGTGKLWESRDAGATWKLGEGLSRPPCPGDSECSLPVACSTAGCLVTDEWTRLGWGATEAASFALPSSIPQGDLDIPLREASECQFDERKPWRGIEGGWRAPRADDAALGDAMWYVIASDADRGSSAVSVLRRGKQEPVVETLLADVAAPQEFAVAVSRQVEGAAAIRYVFPRPGGPSTHIRNVEVAWLNLFTGGVRRMTIADAGPYRPGDVTRSKSRSQVANTNLLSVAGDGLFLRLHSVSTGSQPTLFLDGRTVTEEPAVIVPVMLRDAHHEMARIDGRSYALVLSPTGGVLLGDAAGKQWDWRAFSLMLPQPQRFGVQQSLDIAYMNGSPALHVVTLRGAGSEASLFPLQGTGPVVGAAHAAPTLSDLQQSVPVCSAEQRRLDARVVAPPVAWARFPIVVSDALEPQRVLLTNRAVLHGTPESPCVVAFEAGTVEASDDGREFSALLFPEDWGRAWAFRASEEEGEALVEYRPMACQLGSAPRLSPKTLETLKSQQLRSE